MYKNTWWLDRINKFGTWEFLNVRFRSKKREEFNSRLNKSENSALMLKKGEREKSRAKWRGAWGEAARTAILICPTS